MCTSPDSLIDNNLQTDNDLLKEFESLVNIEFIDEEGVKGALIGERLS